MRIQTDVARGKQDNQQAAGVSQVRTVGLAGSGMVDDATNGIRRVRTDQRGVQREAGVAFRGDSIAGVVVVVVEGDRLAHGECSGEMHVL